MLLFILARELPIYEYDFYTCCLQVLKTGQIDLSQFGVDPSKCKYSASVKINCFAFFFYWVGGSVRLVDINLIIGINSDIAEKPFLTVD